MPLRKTLVGLPVRMTHPQARSAFAALATREPACAMAHSGAAMTLFQPLWPTRTAPPDLARGTDEDQVFPFAATNEAMAYVNKGRVKGKVVVRVR